MISTHGWRVLDDGTLSLFGILTPSGNGQFAAAFNRAGRVVVGLFAGLPGDLAKARSELLTALAALPLTVIGGAGKAQKFREQTPDESGTSGRVVRFVRQDASTSRSMANEQPDFP